ncbi:MAG: nucleoside-diphosphate kinase [Erysipelotrichaceae bacterium]|nr:nucleoside-diphosphate kinase [Erysipelotrichaceae bacterium]MDP3304808.1 nucleoside-diphosphate kinase [Erysipelotrichaceae bacterium]
MKQSTFIIVKPDALKRGLMDDILNYFNELDFHIVREDSVKVDEEKILNHYQEVIERIGSEDFKQAVLREFVDEVVHVVEIEHAQSDVVAWVRDLIGTTDPATARPDTIRGMYGNDTMAQARAENRMLRNLIHASDSDDNVQKELVLWFD